MVGRRSPSPAVALGVLLAVGVGARYMVARQLTVPWISPDEMLYGLLGESLWSDGTLRVRGATTPYYSLLTPALVGAGLESRPGVGGVHVAQFLQTIAMTSTAIPVYLWARRLATTWWAFAAAVVAVCGPVLAYGGLLMTEALFLPACTWAVFALARALEHPTLLRQGVFVGTVTVAATVRMQAIVLLPAFALASLVALRLDRRRARPLVPMTIGILSLLALAAVVRLVAPDLLASSELLGAYATLGTTSPGEAGLVRALVGHSSAVVLAVSVIPAVASALLVADVLRRRPTAPGVQALVATLIGFVPLLVLQVSLFAAGRFDHVSQRYLVSVIPILAVGLAVWATTGAFRERRVVVVVGLAVVGAVAATAPSTLAPPTAMHDALATTPLLRLEGEPDVARLLLATAAATGTLLVALVPRRRLWLLPAVVVVAMLATSIDAASVTVRLSAAEERDALGGVERNWVDANADGPVTLLLSGERPWTTETRTLFWNRSIKRLLSVPAVAGGAPVTPELVAIDPASGVLFDGRRQTIPGGLVAVPSTVTLAGDEVAVMPVGLAHSPALVLWRASTPLRVAQRVSGILPNGDFSGRMTVSVPACERGVLQITLIGKSGDPIVVTADGIVFDTLDVPAGETPTALIPSGRAAGTGGACEFVFETPGYAGTTRIAYVADGA